MEAKDTKEAAQHIADVINVFRIKGDRFSPRSFRKCLQVARCLYYDKIHTYLLRRGYIIIEKGGKCPVSKFANGLALDYVVFDDYINERRGNKIKESVTMEKKSFAIPEGCKAVTVSEESGRLVIEFEEVKKFEPKKGDIISLRSGGSVVIYSGMHSSHGIFNGKIYNYIVSNDMQCWRPANQSETAQLFTALEKEGLKWNAETMEVERLRWKPRHGERYYCLSTDVDMRNDSNEHDEARFKVGDCFKTADDRLAAIDKVKALLLSL